VAKGKRSLYGLKRHGVSETESEEKKKKRQAKENGTNGQNWDSNVGEKTLHKIEVRLRKSGGRRKGSPQGDADSNGEYLGTFVPGGGFVQYFNAIGMFYRGTEGK